MASEIKAPYLTHEQIRTRAKLFLEKYHPEDSYPVPIEDIIEYQLKLDIIPIPGLRDYVEVEGFVSVVSGSISIDDYIYHKRPARCRFTLAHEIGHLI
ncbi:MAG: ImmA/IrrE family metallo-endopeptidase [Candidatus Brocadiales bacterium]